MPIRTVNKQEVEISWEGNYAAGHALTPAEANALNQLVFSTVGKNAANAAETAAKNSEPFDLARYMNENLPAYEFGRLRTTDPVEKRAKDMLRDALNASLREKGRTATEKAKTEFVNGTLAKPEEREKWFKRARKAIEEAKKLGDGLGEFELAAE